MTLVFFKAAQSTNGQPGRRAPATIHPSQRSPADLSKTQTRRHPQEDGSPPPSPFLSPPAPASPDPPSSSCPIFLHSPLHASHLLTSSCSQQTTPSPFRLGLFPGPGVATPSWGASHSDLEISFSTFKAHHPHDLSSEDLPHTHRHHVHCLLLIVKASTSILPTMGWALYVTMALHIFMYFIHP